MKNMVTYYGKIKEELADPLTLLSAVLCFCSLLLLTNNDRLMIAANGVKQSAGLLLSLCAVTVMVLKRTGDCVKCMISLIGIAACDALVFAQSGLHLSLAAAVLLSVFCLLVSKRFDRRYMLVIVFAVLLTTGVLIGFLYDDMYDLLCRFAAGIKNKSALVGTIGNVYRLFVSDSFDDLFYYKEYSRSVVTDSGIVSGAVNLFKDNIGNPSDVVSKYMTGEYFVSIFLTVGAVAALFPTASKKEKRTLLGVGIYAVLFGDARLMALFLLLTNPLAYVGYLFAVFLSFFVSRVIDLRIGFTFSASLTELIRYGHHYPYFLLTGAVLSVMVYFCIKYAFPMGRHIFYNLFSISFLILFSFFFEVIPSSTVDTVLLFR